MTRTLWLVVALPVVLSCSDDAQGQHDAHVDSDLDAPVDALCGADLLYTGEYVDWDSSDDEFLGIFNADWSVNGDTHAHSSEKTPPNGRFILCVDPTSNPVVTITPDPTDTGSNGSDTYLPGIAQAKHTQIGAGVLTSTRSMRLSRVASEFASIGSGSDTYDPTKGQLFVHASGSATSVPLSIDLPHLDTQAYGDEWSSGSAGTYVYFPNITLSGATVTLSSAFAIDGTGEVAITPGVLTYVEVDAP